MIFETMDDVLPFLSFLLKSLGFKAIRISNWYENDSLFFQYKGFVLSHVFKVRVSGTRKWPNNFRCLTFLPCNSVNVKHDHWFTSPGGVLPGMGYIGMCRCEGYGFQAVYSRIGYINQSVWVSNRVSFFRTLISWLKILSKQGIVVSGFVLARLCQWLR